MKKISLALLSLAMVVSVSMEVNALELKTPSLSGVKNAVTTSTSASSSAKDAANAKYQEAYQAKIAAQQKALDAVKVYDKNARLELASVILPKDKVAEIKKLSGEEFDKTINDELIKVLSDAGFRARIDSTDPEDQDKIDKTAYINAVTKIYIADNRYKNVSNELTAPLKAIVDGDVSAISSKDELKNAGAMIFGIKKNLGTNSDLKKAINNVNKGSKGNEKKGIAAVDPIILSIPDSEKVVYPKDGVIGSINYSMNEINTQVNKANLVLANTLLTTEDKKSLQAVNNNKSLSKEEKTAQIMKMTNEFIAKNQEDGTIKKNYDSLTAAQKKEFSDAAGDVVGAVASYGALGLQCTKLGFNISKNPLLAAPLTFELGALKDTGSLLKSSSSNLAKSVTQLKKIMKDNNIAISNATTDVKTNSLNKLKSVGLKK